MNIPEPTITERGFQMLEDIKRECGLIPEPPIEELPSPRHGGPRTSVMPDYKTWRPWKKLEAARKPGELHFSEWVRQEVKDSGFSEGAIQGRFYKGQYKDHLECRKDGKYVFVKRITPKPELRRFPGEITLGEWVRSKAIEMEVSISCIWMRIKRGTMDYPPNTRWLNKNYALVKP